MAMADYRRCDKCGSKAFYDANLNYEDATGNDVVYEVDEHFNYKLDYVGQWAVLCKDCCKEYKCVIVPTGKE